MTYRMVSHEWPLEGDELEQAAYLLEHWRQEVALKQTGGNLSDMDTAAFTHFKDRFYRDVTARLQLFEPAYGRGMFNISPDGKMLVSMKVEAVS